MREINLNRQLLGLEDLAFGTGTVEQTRAGTKVNVTKINAGNLPFDETRTLIEFSQEVNLEELGNSVEAINNLNNDLDKILIVEDNLPIINNVEAIKESIVTLDTNILALQNINTNMSSINTVEDNLPEVISVAQNIVPNLTEILNVDILASQVTQDKASVSSMKLAVETIYDTFDDRFLGTKTVDPILDNDGNTLLDGAIYFNTSSNTMKVYDVSTTTWYSIPQMYLSSLLDVKLTSINTGNVLRWNGIKWINYALSKSDVGLNLVDNTSDINKPVSTAAKTALDLKAPLNSAALVNPTINGIAQSGYSGFKNYIINGGFDVWQRGTSQTSSGYGSDDRWNNQNIGSTKIHSQVACSDIERALFNGGYFSRTVVSSVENVSYIARKYQNIEDVTKLAGKTITISFWAKADSSKNISVELAQVFGTGGTPTGYLISIGAQKVALTSTWQKKEIIISVPSIVGKTLGTDGLHTSYTELCFWFDAGSGFNARAASLGQQSGTFDIAQVQLEEGSVATPFENRPYGLELSLCQRYYQIFRHRLIESRNAGEYASMSVTLPVPMRTAPSVSVVVSSSTLIASIARAVTTTINISEQFTCSSSGIMDYDALRTLSAEL